MAASAWKQGGSSHSNCFHPQLSTRRGGLGPCSFSSAGPGSALGRRADSERSYRSWRRADHRREAANPQASGGKLGGVGQLVWCNRQKTRSCRTFPLGTSYVVSGQLSSARLQGEPCVTGNFRWGRSICSSWCSTQTIAEWKLLVGAGSAIRTPNDYAART